MDSRNLQEINQKIFEQVTNIRGDDIACYLTKFTISADHPTTKKDHSHQMIFLRGKTSMVYLDQSYMHTANRNKSILRLVMEIAAENEMTIDTSEPVIGSFIPYSFPLAQRYDEKGERSAPSFYLTSQDPASLNIAFPLDGSSPPVTIVGGQTMIPLKSDRPCMVVNIRVNFQRNIEGVNLYVFTPYVIDVSTDCKLGDPVKYNQFNDVVLTRMQDCVSGIELMFAHANIISGQQMMQAFDNYAARYGVRVSGTQRLLLTLIQRATDIAESPTEMSFRFKTLDSIDITMRPVSSASFTDAVVKFKRIFGDRAHALNEVLNGSRTIRIPNSAMMEHIGVLNAAIDSVFSNEKILQGYQKFAQRNGMEPFFDMRNGAEKIEEQNHYFRLDNATKLDVIADNVVQNAAQETNKKLQDAEYLLAQRLRLFSQAAMRPDTTQRDINTISETVRKAIAKVEYRSDGLSESLFKTDYKTPINQIQGALSRSQAYKK